MTPEEKAVVEAAQRVSELIKEGTLPVMSAIALQDALVELKKAKQGEPVRASGENTWIEICKSSKIGKGAETAEFIAGHEPDRVFKAMWDKSSTKLTIPIVKSEIQKLLEPFGCSDWVFEIKAYIEDLEELVRNEKVPTQPQRRTLCPMNWNACAGGIRQRRGWLKPFLSLMAKR